MAWAGLWRRRCLMLAISGILLILFCSSAIIFSMIAEIRHPPVRHKEANDESATTTTSTTVTSLTQMLLQSINATTTTTRFSHRTEFRPPELRLYQLPPPPDPSELSTSTVPKHIFMYWNDGFDYGYPTVQLAQQITQFQNPDYTFYFLNAQQAEEWSERLRYVPPHVWQRCGVAGQADIYRTLLLYKYGGIWMDASVLVNRPFSEWLPASTDDLFTFHRTREDKKKKDLDLNIDPWITSWFLATPPRGYMISRIFERLTAGTDDDQTKTRKTKELMHVCTRGVYFWWHELVASLAHDDARIDQRIRTVFPPSMPMHCKGADVEWRNAYVNKRCEIDEMARLFAVTRHCCPSPQRRWIFDSSQQEQYGNGPLLRQHSTLCPQWNCTTLLNNHEALQQHEALIRQAFGGDLPGLDAPLYAPPKRVPGRKIPNMYQVVRQEEEAAQRR